MLKDINYNIFSESLQHSFYTLKNSSGSRLILFRHNWAECKLTINEEDLVKIHVMKFHPPIVALNFTFETALNNILVSMPSPRKFKVKGNYYSNELKEINWKWNGSGPWNDRFILVDKKDNGKELAKINKLMVTNEISGSLNIFDEVPSEFHTLIVASACLVVKFMHESFASGENVCRSYRYSTFSYSPGSSF